MEAKHNDEVGEYKDGSLKVIALPFAVYMREKEDAHYNGNHIPLREYQAVEIIVSHSTSIGDRMKK